MRLSKRSEASRIAESRPVGVRVGGRVLLGEIVEVIRPASSSDRRIVRVVVSDPLTKQATFEVEVPESWLEEPPPRP